MTSKEALKVLYNYNTDKGYDGRYFKIVEKDLDRLEKLEKVIEIIINNYPIKSLYNPDVNGKYGFLIGNFSSYHNYEKYNLLKEVLEDE